MNGYAWIFTALMWLCLAGSLLLFARFIIGDRARGRRRCPKCWYDMSGAAAADGRYTCPECGRIPRALSKTRRRKRWAALATLTLLASYAVFTTPRVRDHGWIGAVPTTALVLSSRTLMDAVFTRDDAPKPILLASRDFFRRVHAGELAGWQRQLLVHGAMRALEDGQFLDGRVYLAKLIELNDDQTRMLDRFVQVTPTTRSEWPSDYPIFLRIDATSWRSQDAALRPVSPGLREISFQAQEASWSHPGGGRAYLGRWYDGLTEWEPLVLGEDNPCFTVIVDSGDEARPGSVTLPIRIVESVDDILEPVHDSAVTEAIRSADPPRLDYHGDDIALFWRNPVADIEVQHPVTVALRFTVYYGAHAAYTGRAWWAATTGRTADEIYIPLTPNICPADQPPGPWPWSVVIESDPEFALRNFDCDRYWKGALVLEASTAPDLPEIVTAD